MKFIAIFILDWSRAVASKKLSWLFKPNQRTGWTLSNCLFFYYLLMTGLWGKNCIISRDGADIKFVGVRFFCLIFLSKGRTLSLICNLIPYVLSNNRPYISGRPVLLVGRILHSKYWQIPYVKQPGYQARSDIRSISRKLSTLYMV